jgi:predicted anti-sigma-YlaC factor YlaD
VAPLVSALLDGELSGTAAAVVAEHVSHCPACGELVVDGGDVKRMLGALRGRPVRPPGDLWDRIARRLDEGA